MLLFCYSFLSFSKSNELDSIVLNSNDTIQKNSGYLMMNLNVLESDSIKFLKKEILDEPYRVKSTTPNCANLINGTIGQLGTWNVTGGRLSAMYFHGNFWLTQTVAWSPELYYRFVVRGAEMLYRSDVTLSNPDVLNYFDCFNFKYSAISGLVGPDNSFKLTDYGIKENVESDGTRVFTLFSNDPSNINNSTIISYNVSSYNINSGDNVTMTASCNNGGWPVWYTTSSYGYGRDIVKVGSPFVTYPTQSTKYVIQCVNEWGGARQETIDIQVNGTPCTALPTGIGTWNVTGHFLLTKSFHGKNWLVQLLPGGFTERFVVRGSEMILRNDVTLESPSYTSLLNCYEWVYSSFGGLASPSTSTFPTPSGYITYTEPDGTRIYEKCSSCRSSNNDLLNIFPNPNFGDFKVSFPLEKEQSEMNLYVIDQTGKMILHQTVKGNIGNNEIPIKLLKTNKGNYTVKIVGKDIDLSKIININ